MMCWKKLCGHLDFAILLMANSLIFNSAFHSIFTNLSMAAHMNESLKLSNF